ncbi:MAG: hypothetical protein QM582_19015 [Micropruina sp.]|uniref:hypothetical protein n=1 Tax=Micropruina sp. TaxID=2737536 RepID=UPI0039E30C5D
MRRVRTAQGAARYKQPIGSIIVMRGGGKKDLNLSHMEDDDLTELMEDAAVHTKNPDVYEAAFTEWARRQPDAEPDLPSYPDPWDEPDPTASDRLFMLEAERDAAYARLDAQVHEDDDTFQDDLDRWDAYSAIIDREQRLAATRTEQPEELADWMQALETPRPDGTATIEPTAAQRREWELMERAEELADTEGIDYEEALGRLQGLDSEQVRRREFVKLGKQQGYAATSFNELIDEVHLRYQMELEFQMEAETNGHFIAGQFNDNDEFWTWWNTSHKTLFSMTDAEARKYMSPEAKKFLDDVGGRVTKSDLVRLVEAGRLGENLDPNVIQGVFSQWDERHKRGDYLQ